MLKKTLSLIFLLFIILNIFSLSSFAAQADKVSLKINSDIAGKTYEDFDSLIEIKSDNVVLNMRHNQPVHISDYAGTVMFGEVKAGRKYYIDYSLSPAQGYTLPEKEYDGFFEIETEKGVKIISARITGGKIRNENGELEKTEGVLIRAQVQIDGNLLQRIAGFIYDAYLKIKAWQLY
ncbi:MAG: hypothetical protein K6B52_04675 [Clostridiales bacterium]|nr:hypothetical protein [Clostridiales bacterium]